MALYLLIFIGLGLIALIEGGGISMALYLLICIGIGLFVSIIPCIIIFLVRKSKVVTFIISALFNLILIYLMMPLLPYDLHNDIWGVGLFVLCTGSAVIIINISFVIFIMFREVKKSVAISKFKKQIM